MESTIAQTPPTTPRSNGSFHGLHLGEEAVSQVSGAPRATRLRHHRKRQQPYVVVLLRMSGPLALRLRTPNMQNLDTNPTSSEKRNRRQSLSAENWIEAALDVISEGGVESVAVEPLARRLGVTKGSFYWHFPNRDALVGRALETVHADRRKDICAGNLGAHGNGRNAQPRRCTAAAARASPYPFS